MEMQKQIPPLVSPQFKAQAHALYSQLRENEPLYSIPMPDGHPTWMLTRYEDILNVLKDERFVSNFRNAMSAEQVSQLIPQNPFFQILSTNMLLQDGADHARLRNLIHKVFTPRMVESLRGRIHEICDELLDAVQDKHEMDIIADYALRIPVTVISEMLGIPKAERGKFHELSSAILSAGSTMAELAKVAPQMKAFIEYIQAQIAIRRQTPTDDLITHLMNIEEAGDRLSEPEMLAMIMLLLTAGHETTVNLIGNGLYMLLKHPDQMALLKQNPDLIETAIEELLRYCSPVEIVSLRYAREDVVLHGQSIPKGGRLLVVIGSANRDAAAFEGADTLDITRQQNKHLAFGHGVHYCVGAPLARLEGQIAIPKLLNRLPELALKSDVTLSWRPSLLMRGLVELPVTF